MRSKEQISTWQLVVLFNISLIGSAIVNIPQPLLAAARNGAWISIMFASAYSLIPLACILYLHKQYPEYTFVEYTKALTGKVLSLVILIPFLSMPFILLPNMVLDIGVFFNSTMMKETPIYVFNFLILMTAAMTVQAGVEVMARMFTLLLMVMTLSVILVLLLVIPLYKPEYLLPVLPKGWMPPLHGAYISSSFPFADVVLVSFLLPFTKEADTSKIRKVLYFSLLVASFSLVLVTVCTAMILGPTSGTVKFSLYELARLINVGEIVERIEMLVGITLIAGSYMKTTIVLYVLTKGLSQLLQLHNSKILIYPVAWIAFLLTLTMYGSQAEFLENVSVSRPLMSLTVSVLPTIVVAIVAAMKGHKTAGSEQQPDPSS